MILSELKVNYVIPFVLRRQVMGQTEGRFSLFFTSIRWKVKLEVEPDNYKSREVS